MQIDSRSAFHSRALNLALCSTLLFTPAACASTPGTWTSAREPLAKLPDLAPACKDYVSGRGAADGTRFNGIIRQAKAGKAPSDQEMRALQTAFTDDYNAVMSLCEDSAPKGSIAQFLVVEHAVGIALDMSQIASYLRDRQNGCHFAQQATEVQAEAQLLGGYSKLINEHPSAAQQVRAWVDDLTLQGERLRSEACG